jgi:predicted outer membrane protein
MSYAPMPTPRALRPVTPRARRPVPIARARGPADVLRAAARLAFAVALGGALGAAAAAVGEDAEEPPSAASAVAAAPSAAPPPALLFAELDATLGVAIEQGQLAALQANDVALRAFAVQQVGRYEELRGELRALAGRLGVGRPTARLAVANGDSLQALKLARGARFDRAYVRQALDVHEALLTDLDAALRIVENAEVRQALEELRGAMDADRPDGMRPR